MNNNAPTTKTTVKTKKNKTTQFSNYLSKLGIRDFSGFFEGFRALDPENNGKNRANHEFSRFLNCFKNYVFMMFFVFLCFYTGFRFVSFFWGGFHGQDLETIVKIKENHDFQVS